MMGTLYGVSTGPGDPELLTLKAVRILNECRTIAAPRKKDGTSLALRIVQGMVDMSSKEILLLDFPMTKDKLHLRANAERIADRICEVLKNGDAAMLCLGDASVYGTFPEIGMRVAERGFRVETVPGVTSFCAAASGKNLPLVSGDVPMQILPYGCEHFAERLRLPGSKVILKCGTHLPELADLLKGSDQLQYAYAVENCSLPDERYVPLEEAETCGYFTLCVVHADA